MSAPLAFAHEAGEQVSGSGIMLAAPLVQEHESETPVTGSISTPGAANHYDSKPE